MHEGSRACHSGEERRRDHRLGIVLVLRNQNLSNEADDGQMMGAKVGECFERMVVRAVQIRWGGGSQVKEKGVDVSSVGVVDSCKSFGRVRHNSRFQG